MAHIVEAITYEDELVFEFFETEEEVVEFIATVPVYEVFSSED